MKLLIKYTSIVIMALTTTFASTETEIEARVGAKVICPSVNSYGVEKSAVFRKHSTNKKILNETTRLSTPFDFSLNMILLTKETFSSYISLVDEAIMSKEYYMDMYLREQDLIHKMFEKRNTFKTLHVETLARGEVRYVVGFHRLQDGDLVAQLVSASRPGFEPQRGQIFF